MKRPLRSKGPVFIDTHALVAIVNADDEHHEMTARLLSDVVQQRVPVFTSDWVLAEFLSVCSRRPLRAAAGKVAASVRASPLTTVVEASRATWDRAFDLFRARRDKEWSLVDCTTIILCEDNSVRRVLTHDHHFAQAGLEVMID